MDSDFLEQYPHAKKILQKMTLDEAFEHTKIELEKAKEKAKRLEKKRKK